MTVLTSCSLPERTGSGYWTKQGILADPVRCEERAETAGKEEVLQEGEVRAGLEPLVDYLKSYSSPTQRGKIPVAVVAPPAAAFEAVADQGEK